MTANSRGGTFTESNDFFIMATHNANTHPDHVERMTHDPNPPAVKPAVEARQGNILGVVRYVLIISVALTIIGFIAAYLVG